MVLPLSQRGSFDASIVRAVRYIPGQIIWARARQRMDADHTRAGASICRNRRQISLALVYVYTTTRPCTINEYTPPASYG